MEVLLSNSSHIIALSEIPVVLVIKTQIISLGNNAFQIFSEVSKCLFNDNLYNTANERLNDIDGLICSPVSYARYFHNMTPDETIFIGFFGGIVIIIASFFSDKIIQYKKGSPGEWILKTLGEKWVRIMYALLGLALIITCVWLFYRR